MFAAAQTNTGYREFHTIVNGLKIITIIQEIM